MNAIGMLIGGETGPAVSGRTFERRNPVSGDVVTTAAAGDVADAVAAADAAAAAFPAWSKVGPNERRARLLAAADGLRARTKEFIEAMVAETGATAGWAGFNVMLGAGQLTEAAALTTQISGQTIPSDVPGNIAMSMRVPAGVVLGIAPWNAPIILGVRAVAVPIACGNTAILKASEQCPAVHALIGTVLQEAGLGDGIMNVVTNAPADAGAVVAALIAHKAVRRVNFTGSTGVGRIIARTAAEHLKPVLLELGGKAPLVVLEDADLDEAVNAALFGAFMNQGQICMSTERLVVVEAVADAFVAKLAARTKTLRAGDPSQGNTVLGAVVNEPAAARVEEMVDDAVGKGAVLAAGGQRAGAIMQPTIVDRVTPSMALYAEESFGPVVSVIRAADTEDAVRIANDSEYGLSAAVFSENVGRAFEVAARLKSGICHINGPTVHDEAQMPFGGVGASGYGRFGGQAGIAEFTDLRWITVQTGHRHYPF